MNKAVILDRYKDYEDRILVNQIFEMAEQCVRDYTYRCTSFLDPRQQKIAEAVMHHIHDISYHFDGKREEGERKICIIFHEDFDTETIVPPIAVLQLNWHPKDKKISHRDILGSLMGSGIKRETLGDIILEEQSAYVICDSGIAQYLEYNLNRIGSTAVSVSIAHTLKQGTEKIKLINTTVASLRLDCILGAGFNLSRSKAADYIKGGKVKLNWDEENSTAKEVKAGDVISLRGGGRIIVEDVAGTTKKDRIKLTIKKLL